MRIDIFTLFPSMFTGPFDESILNRAKGKGLVNIKTHNIRDYAFNKHKSVDDTPYGGGAGMIMRVDVIINALETTYDMKLPQSDPKVGIYLMSAKGKPFTQEVAHNFSQNFDHLVLICGHYEGVDERLLTFITGELSVGSFVLTGGELAAMAVTNAVTRLLPGVINKESLEEESFSQENTTEYPQYTKPADFRGQKVPDVLVSGNHAKIKQWRQSMIKQLKRPQQ